MSVDRRGERSLIEARGPERPLPEEEKRDTLVKDEREPRAKEHSTP